MNKKQQHQAGVAAIENSDYVMRKRNIMEESWSVDVKPNVIDRGCFIEK